jgi:hypothetical protein
MFLGRMEQAMHSLRQPIPVDETPSAPSGNPAIHCLTYCQNVAGLWLKYGAKPVNIGTSLWYEIIARDVMIC